MMSLRTNQASPIKDPISALVQGKSGGALALIIRVDGPSYRPLGAMMAIFADGTRVGTLSSGCIESDLVLHAKKALKSGESARLLYGLGSPFIDIQLPCGGGLEILILPNPDTEILREIDDLRLARQPSTLSIDLVSGEVQALSTGQTGLSGTRFLIRIQPETSFYVFGKGPEASTFSSLVQASGFPNLLLSPDRETLEFGAQAGCETRHLTSAKFPSDILPDPWSAVILFFHDHEWEPPILKNALATKAFYIGAQGSQRARDLRLEALRQMGATGLERLRGPIGLIPSVRDARMLAVSVLAEILDTSRRV
ncbi:MAG: XdhC family protein [Alphaproteobacteria bacterium]|nr:XdhC family protein [Alphaproteobacteria bacterium]